MGLMERKVTGDLMEMMVPRERRECVEEQDPR